jgi:carbon starvation protein
MSSVMIVLLGIAGFTFGWFVYSRFIASKIYRLDPNFVTPAHEFNDSVDYVPTNKFVLWGAHFTSVAGAAPIVGPAIAVYWGWVPAVLWVTFGSIFFAGVHDMGALWASSRHGAKSIGALSESVIGKRTRSLFMIVIFLLLLMVNAVFGTIIAGEMVHIPTSVFPAWAAIPVAVAIGFLIRRKANLLLISVIGVSILYYTIYVGSVMPLALPENFLWMNENAAWIILLFTYAAIASMLPVWMLLQPRDYINGAQLVVGLFLLYGAVFLALPDITAPAFNDQLAEGTPPIFPLLFITIACGALSGFHGIVASGTSSKQLNKETDARFVGYLGALGEGSLALITIVAVSGAMYASSPEAWHALYSQFGQGGASAFITGGGNLLSEAWGMPSLFAMTLLATMVVLFAGTTMDAGVRLQRYIIQEWGSIYNINILKSNVPATFVAVGSCLLLAFGAGGASGSGGNVIWPLFGATNQILASLTLLVISILLMKLSRPAKYTLMPMVFVLFMSVWGSMIQMASYFRNDQWLLVVLSVAVLIASILVILEAVSVISSLKKDQNSVASEDTAK